MFAKCEKFADKFAPLINDLYRYSLCGFRRWATKERDSLSIFLARSLPSLSLRESSAKILSRRYTCTTSRYRKSILTTTEKATSALSLPARRLTHAWAAVIVRLSSVFLDAVSPSSFPSEGWEGAAKATRDRLFKLLAIASVTDHCDTQTPNIATVKLHKSTRAAAGFNFEASYIYVFIFSSIIYRTENFFLNRTLKRLDSFIIIKLFKSLSI